MKFHSLLMKVRALLLFGAAIVMYAMPVLAQPGNLATSLHGTRVGKDFWYSAENGGFEAFTGVSIEELECMECHGPKDADGNPYPDPFVNPGGPDGYCAACHSTTMFPVSQDQCYSCHGRQSAEIGRGYSDVHRDAGMLCWDCHGTGDMHGDGTEYVSMLEPGAIDVDCEDCHSIAGGTIPADHASYDPHNGKLHCKACHTQSVISCYNCHFESQVDAHVKRARAQITDFVMLVNREKDGKVHPATFQSLSYQGTAFVAFAPYTAHTITNVGRDCGECHNQWGGNNETINDYNEDLEIVFAREQEGPAGLIWKRGIVPMPEDYLDSFKMDFVTYTGDPSDPPVPSPLWEPIGKDTWDGSQMFFATPLSREQMDALGFAFKVSMDIKPGSCPNSVSAQRRGTLPLAVVGTDDLSVDTVDPDSLMLEGVPALRVSYEDVTAPDVADACGCSEAGPDGRMDLTVRFSKSAILEAIGDREPGADVLLSLTGQTKDGRPFVAQDCIVLVRQPMGKMRGR